MGKFLLYKDKQDKGAITIVTITAVLLPILLLLPLMLLLTQMLVLYLLLPPNGG